jgi:hypothetical protein
MKSATKSVPNGAAETPVPFEITLPEDTPEYMAPAYFGCLRWALGFDPILDSFFEVTGISLSPARSGINKLVDDATGFDPNENFLRAFLPWFDEQVWGKMDEPGEE